MNPGYIAQCIIIQFNLSGRETGFQLKRNTRTRYISSHTRKRAAEFRTWITEIGVSKINSCHDSEQFPNVMFIASLITNILLLISVNPDVSAFATDFITNPRSCLPRKRFPHTFRTLRNLIPGQNLLGFNS